MSRYPALNERGGRAVLVQARVSDADHDALVELARRKGLKQPEMIREIMRWAIAKYVAEEDTGPPETAADRAPRR
jgi:hypothetical protein